MTTVDERYQELAQRAIAAGVLHTRIGPRDVMGTYDHITRTLTWQADYAVRDEAYVKDLLSQEDAEDRGYV